MFENKQVYQYGLLTLFLLCLYLSGCNSDKSQFLKAIQTNDWHSAQVVLDRSPELISTYTKNGLSLLHIAVEQNNIDLAKFLIKNGIDSNAGTKADHQTPLHFAAAMGRSEIASLLIDNGADINSQDSLDVTPLHLACQFSSREIVKLLLERGAEVDAKTQDKKTPLYYVACSNSSNTRSDMEIIRMLLDKGADLNFKCGTEYPIIVHALANRQFKKAELLGEYGAILELPTKEGIKPLNGDELKQYIKEISCIPEQNQSF